MIAMVCRAGAVYSDEIGRGVSATQSQLKDRGLDPTGRLSLAIHACGWSLAHCTDSYHFCILATDC